jgi:hypothetical protein
MASRTEPCPPTAAELEGAELIDGVPFLGPPTRYTTTRGERDAHGAVAFTTTQFVLSAACAGPEISGEAYQRFLPVPVPN